MNTAQSSRSFLELLELALELLEVVLDFLEVVLELLEVVLELLELQETAKPHAKPRGPTGTGWLICNFQVSLRAT